MSDDRREQFETLSVELVERFGAWLGDRRGAAAGQWLLDYKWAIGEGFPAKWTSGDIDELLFGYMPDMVIWDFDDLTDPVEPMAQFIEFLGAEGLMAAGSDDAEDLAEHLRGHGRDFLDAMADPEAGVPSKRLVMAMLADDVDVEDEAAVDEWIDGFNAAPDEVLYAVLGPRGSLDDLDEPGIVLPPRAPVDENLLNESAAAVPMLGMVVGLAEFMGAGRPLTAKGNLKLADARELVDVLGTGDVVDRTWGDVTQKLRSAEQLRGLDLVFTTAIQMRAVKTVRGKMSANKSWLRGTEAHPLGRAEELAEILLAEGPLETAAGRWRRFNETDLVVNGSWAPILARLYEEEQVFEETVETLLMAVDQLVELDEWYLSEEGRQFHERAVHRDLERLVVIMEWSGVLTWTDYEWEEDRYGFENRVGGTLTITPFGEWLLQGPLTMSGLVSAPVVRPLSVSVDDPPEKIVEALAEYLPDGPASVAEAWAQLGADQDLPERLWRVALPDTVAVLETLGANLADKATAKAARKALLKHRSWIAGQN